MVAKRPRDCARRDLQILILVGEGGSDFNAANVKLRLTKAIPERIGDPGLTAISVRIAYLWDDIEVMAKEETPHLVVVYAHGRSKPTPAVLVRDKVWLGVGELADHIAAGSTVPPHWVFVSCSVGENPSKDELARFPNAFQELSPQQACQIVSCGILQCLRREVIAELSEWLSRKDLVVGLDAV